MLGLRRHVYAIKISKVIISAVIKLVNYVMQFIQDTV